MTIRDIIEAASYEDYPPSFGHADQAFIAVFNPEHVALMEAVAEAASDFVEVYEKWEDKHATDHQVFAKREVLGYQCRQLADYRKERGLL